MFKNLSLSKKISSGFAVILVLFFILALVGRVGLGRVVDKVESANRFQNLERHIVKARQYEKAFLLSSDPAAGKIVKKEVGSLRDLADRIRDRNESDTVKNTVSDILEQSDRYLAAFSNVAEMAEKKKARMAQMNQKADFALETTAEIRDEQKEAYKELGYDSELKISRMRTMVSLSNGMREIFLEIKGFRRLLSQTEFDDTLSVYTEWKGKHNDLKLLAEKLSPMLENEDSTKRLEKVLAEQENCIERADSFFRDKSGQNNQALIEAVKSFERAITYFQQEMQENLEFYIQDVRYLSDQMTELSSSADRIANILLKARILEKEFIRTEDREVFNAAKEQIGSIENVIASVGESMEDQEKIELVEGISSSVENYLASFTEFAGLIERQQSAQSVMEKASAAIQENCLQAKTLQLDKMQAQIGNSRSLITLVSVCAVLFGVVTAFVLIRLLIRPIRTVSDALGEISQGEGDLTKRIEVRTKDEIGELATRFNTFIERLNHIIVDIGSNSETVTAASGEVLSISEQMAEDSEDLSSRSNSVATAAEEMSTSMNTVATASEQAATNLSAVAEAAGQMKSTLGEVSENCTNARDVSNNAADQVKNASDRVKRLGDSADAISEVTELITEIAEQTNLLALNATIEAARAGEAGKGFAVVASEIKGLAGQTADATEDIRKKIADIQTSTGDTVTDVEKISEVISEVTENVTAISAAVEEQSVSAAEVAENIDQASSGIGEVNENVAQISQVSSQIAEDISKVNAVAGDMSGRSSRMNSSAKDLSDLSAKLRDMIAVFRVSAEKGGKENGTAGQGVEGHPADEIPDLMPWSEKFVTGIPSIDEQHMELVKMVNELHRAMKRKAGTEQAGDILTRLADYTGYHFGHEEALFEEYGYPEKKEHKQIHDDLVAKVGEFKTEFENGRAALSMDLMTFLTDWLKNHILKTDMAYVSHLKEKGAE